MEPAKKLYREVYTEDPALATSDRLLQLLILDYLRKKGHPSYTMLMKESGMIGSAGKETFIYLSYW